MKTTRTTTKRAILGILVTCSVCAVNQAREIVQPNESQQMGGVPYDELETIYAASAPDVIFDNLDRTPGERYNSSSWFAIIGNGIPGWNETWIAVRFVPEVDFQAKMLLAAIGNVSGLSGEKLVDIGLYANNENTGEVGDPLPGGQGSTTQLPEAGECCRLASVTLEGEGVILTAHTVYWLVGSPSPDGPTFWGGWHKSNRARFAAIAPPFPWQNNPGAWPAAQIRGTRLHGAGPEKRTNSEAVSPDKKVPAASVTIFSNLNRSAPDPLYNYGFGLPINGDEVPFTEEGWAALPFTAKKDVHAKTLAVAVALKSGEEVLNVGVYSDNDGTVGEPLPGGQGSTARIPELGECCDLAKVRLPGAGIALSANTQYWLVASPGAPTFQGVWQHSVLALWGYQEVIFPGFTNWTTLDGLWLAAEIRGTSP